MNSIQIFLQTVWGSLVAFGWIKVLVALVIIGLLSKWQKLLGVLAALLFIAYLAHWI